MKETRVASGPFLSRLWFEAHEFDDIAREKLKCHGLLPREPAPIDIELFVEVEFGFAYEFRNLGEDCLGLMNFSEKGPKSLFIHSKLDKPENPTVNRRCRSTLAHECGHGLLHAGLFAELWESKRRTNSFADSTRLITWQERAENFDAEQKPTAKEWWEYQANQMISCLLLPLAPLRNALRAFGLEPATLR